MSDSSSEPTMYRVSEAAEKAGVTRQMLQYYLMVGLVEPTDMTQAGHQLFDDKAIERIKLVRQLNESGYPLREIREIFLRRSSPGS